MLKISENNERLLEIKNGFLEFKFYKSGEDKGTFDISYSDFKESHMKIVRCYSAINYYDNNSINEFSSKKLEFREEIIELDDELGEGFRIRLHQKDNHKDLFRFSIEFKFYDDKEFFLVRIINIDDIDSNFKIHSISPFIIKNQKIWLTGTDQNSELANLSWFKNGWQSWSPCRLFFGNEKDREGPPLKIFKRTLDNQDYGLKGRFYSEYNTVITDVKSKNSLLLGFVTLQDQFSRIILDYKRSPNINFLSAISCMDGVRFSDSSINTSEELFVGFKTNNRAYYGLIEYAEIVEMNIEEERIQEIPVGWCSWYYYFTEVSQVDMIKNLNFFKKNKEKLPIDFFQLDDGYFTKIGDYSNVNEKFQDGLYQLFHKVEEAGFNSGLWTAPFLAVKDSEIFENHEDWFLKKINEDKFLKTNYNWGNFQYGLDLSKPEVNTYLKDFFNKLRFAFKDENSNDPLIEFYKIDFLHAGAPNDADYERKDLTRAQIYRNGIKAIREGITDDSFLLGCGAPLGPCVGLVDAMRISMDTGPEWKKLDKLGHKFSFSLPNLKRALMNILYRSFMHRHFWINDPDCLMIRRTDTDLTEDEIKLQLTLFGLSGGQILISDDMSKLKEQEIEDAKLVVPPYNPEGYDPILTDAFITELPSIYFLETNEFIGKRYLVSIINWAEDQVSRKIRIEEIIPNLPLDEEDFFIFDFWNQKFLGEYKRDDVININGIKPHFCSYLSVLPVYEIDRVEPVFLSSNLHISQGCYEITDFSYDNEEDVISIIIDLSGERKGTLFIKLPKNKKISESDFPFSLDDKNNNIWKIDVELFDNTSFEIILS
ncbi:MAG: hypothetical protein GF317_23050 [Candidatus Lokiarchaeota archaeon]|nr:hypothetical protein [Candidatus Lokiarchaeota archaeon]MBD3202322.1 hypothetical protein [Candidatus Lokiarchaeota archaeon]